MNSKVVSMLATALLLCGCAKKSTFDEDYAKADMKLKSDMKDIDADLNTALKKEPGEAVDIPQKDTQH
jgi:PBP1b-binding outer membrane lipoprotein LpoB